MICGVVCNRYVQILHILKPRQLIVSINRYWAVMVNAKSFILSEKKKQKKKKKKHRMSSATILFSAYKVNFTILLFAVKHRMNKCCTRKITIIGRLSLLPWSRCPQRSNDKLDDFISIDEFLSYCQTNTSIQLNIVNTRLYYNCSLYPCVHLLLAEPTGENINGV